MKNKTFNRILTISIITIILLNWVFNYIVFSASTNETLEDIEITLGNVGQQYYIDIKRQAVEALRSQLEEKYNYKGTVEELAEICEIDLNNGTAIENISPSGKQIKIDEDTTIILGFDMSITTGADKSHSSPLNPTGAYTVITIGDIDVIKNTGIDNNEQNNQDAADSNNVSSVNEIIVNGQVYEGDTDWDIGGVLLKPFFFLVNCVVDTLLAVLQKVMYSDVTDQNKITNYVKTNYIDKLRVVDSRNIDTMFDLSTNQIDCNIGITAKIGSTEYPHIHYSPEEIFSGQISLLNIDFISGVDQAEGLGVVRKTIASWYNALRIIATVGFLCVLIYIGIKIIGSSNVKDKSKYKQWIIDWIIGLLILYTMHYIMAFIITIINQFNEKTITVMPILRVAAGNGYESFSTNLIGLVRFCTQYDLIALKIGYEIMYIMLVVYTFKFTFVYVRRVIYMAFLTVIAPLVAFTYPIDKSLDGKAQGFTMWLKEFFFNALLQPMHYLLYYIMVFSSIQIAVDNPFYAIAVLAFMTEAERLIRKIFGFDKAREGTVGGLGTAFSGLALVHGAKRLSGSGKQIANSGATSSVSYPGAINKDYKENGNDFISAGEDISNISDNNNVIDNSSNNIIIPNNYVGNNNQTVNINPVVNTVSEDQDGTISPMFTMGGSGRPRLIGKLNEPEKPKNPIINQIEPKLQPIRRLARNINNSKPAQTAIYLANTKVGRGTRAIGKRMVKPIWDFDRSGKYNGKRLIRNVIKGTVGITVGVTAAAVQAGISLTDGKYNPAEGAAAFAAGFALVGRGVDGVANTFEEGYNESLTKPEKMEVYKEEFKNREDVIQFCKDNYGTEWKEYRDRIVDNYVTRGYIDLKEIKQCIKYSNAVANEVNNNRTYLNTTQKKKALKQEKKKQDVIAMYIMSQKRKRAKIHASAASYNKRKEERYIHSLTQSLGNHPGLGPQQGMTAPQQGVGTQGSNVSQRGLGPMQTTRQNQVQRIRRQEMNISAAIRTFDRITNG